ncbi:MAG: peroxiredoxin [Woeseiaceae bacterium]|nr:peroxiredoxin [Woeseiaceae bacterium]
MLNAGSVAPEFILPDEAGVEVSLSQLLQAGPLVLYFYPADFTPGCTKEACSIRDMHDDIMAVGLQVVGISPQDAESHKRFREQHKLPFRLLSDTEKVAIKMYDVDGPFGVGVRRVTYLINQGKKIQAAVQADILVGRHTDFIQKAIMLRETAGMRKPDDRDESP